MAESRVRQAKRAGGYVATAHGWRLVTQATPEELGEEQPELTGSEREADYQAAQARAALASAAHTEEETESEPTLEQRDREECPDCGKPVAVNKDGSLRKHTCVIEALTPEVTFEEGD